ncbi:MAG: hypothetical protein V1685_04525 [Parcubacteria group bacterium]
MSTRKCWAVKRSWSEDCDLRVFRKSSVAKADRLEEAGRLTYYADSEGDTYLLVVGAYRDLPQGLDWEISGPYEWTECPWQSLGSFAEEFPELCPKKYRED